MVKFLLIISILLPISCVNSSIESNDDLGVWVFLNGQVSKTDGSQIVFVGRLVNKSEKEYFVRLEERNMDEIFPLGAGYANKSSSRLEPWWHEEFRILDRWIGLRPGGEKSFSFFLSKEDFTDSIALLFEVYEDSTFQKRDVIAVNCAFVTPDSVKSYSQYAWRHDSELLKTHSLPKEELHPAYDQLRRKNKLPQKRNRGSDR